MVHEPPAEVVHEAPTEDASETCNGAEEVPLTSSEIGETSGPTNAADGEPAASETTVGLTESRSPTAKTVTVSTDAWLALRNERHMRERHIKALQEQIKVAQAELDQLDEVRVHLREQRSLALEARRQGTELYEASLLAHEELLSLRAEHMEKKKEMEERKLEDQANRIEDSCPEPLVAEHEQDNEHDDEAHSDPSSPSTELSAKEREQRALEWRRLLSERETTARELGIALQRVEELEAALEDRRVELRIAERRRERERRSLLTALRELGGGNSKGNEHAGECAEVSGASATVPCAVECQYLLRIGELEAQAADLREQLDAVQAREAALNESANVRAGALRRAATTVATGSTSIGRSEDALKEALDPSSAPRQAVRRKGRADLEGLTRMLEGLFVENFRLRSGGSKVSCAPHNPQKGKTHEGDDELEEDSTYVAGPGPRVDLYRFVREDDAASDDETCTVPRTKTASAATFSTAASCSATSAEPATAFQTTNSWSAASAETVSFPDSVALPAEDTCSIEHL